jgi:hypothetical protein
VPARRSQLVPRENFDVEVPEGTHLGFSRGTDGAYRAHLFDDETNALVGHAELFEPAEGEYVGSVMDAQPVYINVDNDRSSSQEDKAQLQDVLGALAVLGIIVAAQRAAPHLKRWWNDQALPFLRKSKNRLSKPYRSKSDAAVVESFALMDPAPEASPQDVFTALDEYRASMSSAEARDRFVAALVARLFSERQLRLLRNARIEDEGVALELASAMESLTPQQLGESITLMLEANPSWPDEDTLAELGKLLGGGRADGGVSPIRSKQIENGRRLTRDKE